ncbi:hypothetical protein PBT90_00050 [Algoriphagus halophytocola]|uniref:hypothetical protein n=1 Tax=Algoriphagus halophytocola TaxID=2991499 RepID=UPI0022DD0B94|nr:hypothetical protein [Algoriphagus sp. TR-M9]WBL42364.1 hypothetical protein PBT90_16635 [Algoriphagus sp. TR-M9]WBL43099.1 hypothetical protein PBT90_00050 [Algoriphagus sp. TR-M9]
MTHQELTKVRALVERRNSLMEDLSMINQHILMVIAKDAVASLEFEKISLNKEKKPQANEGFEHMIFSRLRDAGMIKIDAPELKLKNIKSINLDETLLLKLVGVIRDHITDKLSEINRELLELGLEP